MFGTLLVPLLLCHPGPGERPNAEEEGFQEALVAAVHRFAEDGELDHLRAVLDRHPKLVNRKQSFRGNRKPYWSDEYTALHRAAERGRDAVIAYLIEKGANVNATGPLDWTPLHVAVHKGDLAIVKQLVKAGAKLDAKTFPVPEMVGVPGAPPNVPPQVNPAIPSRTPLDMAQEAKHPAIVAFLKAAAK